MRVTKGCKARKLSTFLGILTHTTHCQSTAVSISLIHSLLKLMIFNQQRSKVAWPLAVI